MQSLRNYPWCCLLLLACAACSDGKPGTAEGTTTGTTTGTTNETTNENPGETTIETTALPTTGGEECGLAQAADQCCCFAHAAGCEAPTQVLCEATVACDDVMVVSEDENVDFVENPAALECALMALRDRKPGQIRVIQHWGMPEVQNDWSFLYVQADGTVFANRGYALDDPYAWEIVRRSLPPAEMFEQCLLESDSAARLECVRQAGLGEPIESCVPDCEPAGA